MDHGVLAQPPVIVGLKPDSGRCSRGRSPEEKHAPDLREKQDLAIYNPVSSKSLKQEFLLFSHSSLSLSTRTRTPTHSSTVSASFSF